MDAPRPPPPPVSSASVAPPRGRERREHVAQPFNIGRLALRRLLTRLGRAVLIRLAKQGLAKPQLKQIHSRLCNRVGRVVEAVGQPLAEGVKGRRAIYDRVNVAERLLNVLRISQLALKDLEAVQAVAALPLLVKLHRHRLGEAAAVADTPRRCNVHLAFLRANLVRQPTVALVRVGGRAHESTHRHLRVIAEELAADHRTNATICAGDGDGAARQLEGMHQRQQERDEL